MKRGVTASGKQVRGHADRKRLAQNQPPESKEHLYERMRERSPQEPFIKRFIKWWRET